MMELYHGTDCIFSKFNLKYADSPIRDFGAGIYILVSARNMLNPLVLVKPVIESMKNG